ncbi:MAG: rod shape-determining protein MreC [Patescibacteria group bacterium]
MNRLLRSTIIGLIIVVVLIALNYLGPLKPIKNLIVDSLAPVQGRLYDFNLGANAFYNSWLTRRDLLAENQKLQEQLKNNQVDLARLNSLQEENDLVKKELNFVEEKKMRYVAAKIITGVSDTLSQSVIINRGRRDGLENGLAVVTGDGILIGKIIDAEDDFSKVLLLTDNKSKVAAAVQNSDHTVGLVEGQFGLSFSMTNIPQDQQIKEGDLVLTSGLEGKIPKSLLIAKVESVRQVESEIFKTALLRPIVPFGNLSDVLVIIP